MIHIGFFAYLALRDADGGDAGFVQGAGGLRVTVAPDGRWTVALVPLRPGWDEEGAEPAWRLDGDAGDAKALALLDAIVGWAAGDGSLDRPADAAD